MNLNAQNFVAAIKQICDEKKIEADIVLEAVKDALKAAYRKDFGNREQDLEILLDKDTGKATVLLVKTVVEEVVNKHAEISYEDAQKIKKGIKLGAKIKMDVTPMDYGRIASQSAKQVIIQKIQEAERKGIYEEYSNRSDELLNALVHRVEGRFVYLELDRTTAVLEPRDQIPREKYRAGQRTKVYLEKVEMTPRGPVLKVSRAHPRLIFRLMELEIPEVRNGIVVVKAIARDPGVRCKIVVDSTDDSVDPVGACVGQRGVRIQNITDEVNGERIDVIQWSENFETMLRETLSPAKLDYIIKHEAEKRVEVYVEEDQRALAIGKNGQNVRLAGIILGWEIDILNTAELSSNADDKAKKEEVAEEKVEASETPVAEEKIETPEVVAEEKKE
ncbi:MAG: transcription termination factor NusA [Candidatus Gracilibacteria bacterium]|jgi:N utilization substance protein A